MGFNATAAVGLDNDDGEAVAPATPSAIHKCDLSFLPSYDSNSATVVAKAI